MNPFEELIKSLGEELALPLKVNVNQACRFRIENQFSVQIELAKSADQVLIGANVGSLLPGSYRNEILFQAMRMNGIVEEPSGIVAYSVKTNSLFLFQYLPLVYLDSKKMAAFLARFISHSRFWYEAIAEETIPEPVQWAST